MKIKPFAAQGNFTQFHNYVLDEIMPALKPCHWKVLCFIIRRTRGFQRQSDALSDTQIITGTQIKSSATVRAALKELTGRGYVVASSGGQWETTNYRLNTSFEAAAPASIIEAEDDTLALKNEAVSLQKLKTRG
ncbi:MAG: replication protein [Pyrinomonadaceae bacterium]